MDVKNKLLFLIFGFLMSLFLPNYVTAAFTFSAHDTKGAMLNFSNPALITGTCPSGKTCASNGAGAAYAGAKYKYTNVITVDGIQVDAIVSVDAIVNATLNTFDDPAPNPTPAKSPDPDESWREHTITSGHHNDYLTKFGVVVPEGAIFAPQITAVSHTADAHVDFTISFQDTSGNPVVLKNVYNNTLDVESVEYNEFGGFQSYAFASDYKTNNVQHMIATAGLSGKTRFSNSNCPGNAGLYITDASRVQTKFDTITTLKITNGQHANGTVPNGSGGVTSCTNTSIRYYGAIFVQDQFTDTGNPGVETTVPTVNMLTTSNTKPSVTGTIGGAVSTASPTGSALATGDTFSVVLNGVTYTAPNANLVINGVNWTLNVPTALPVQTYDVVATRNGVLVDQTTNELVITPLCTLPQVLNSTGTACVTPASTDTILCHSGDGLSYAHLIIPSTGVTGHETHPFDVEAVNGLCPGETLTCTLPQVLNAAKTACVTPVVTCVAPKILDTTTNTCITPNPACTAVTNPLPTTMPTGAEYDGKKVTICHFPPGNPGNVRTISISVNALAPHVGNHGDTIWQDGKNCPSLPSECPPPPPPTPTYPTVDSQTTKSHFPTITGTVGTTPITNSGTFSVAVNGTTYSCAFKSPGNSGKLNASCGALIIDSITGWKLTPTTSIPVGVYDVVATRNVVGETLTTDQTTNELTIIDSSCPTGTGLINNVCVAQPVVTVNSQTTTDTTPLITGTVGNVALDTGESFYVSVNGKTYTNGDGNLSVSGLNWSLQIPSANTIPVGLYDVAGGRDDGLPDTTTDELRIDPICTATQVLVNHVCLDAPTVVSQTTYNTKPTITGTVGTTALGSTEAFSVTVNGVIYALGNSNLTISGLNWSLNIPTALPVNTYDVDALRAGLAHDQTTGELVILPLVSPTVDSKTTTDKVAVPLTGSVGSSTSLQIQVRDAFNAIQDSGTATIIGTTWSFLPKVLPAGKYNIVATGDAAHGNLTDSTTDELIVTQTLVVSPTVNNTTTTDKIAPTLTGTLGTSKSLTITVVDSNGLTKASGSATISGTNWSYTPSSPIAAGTYDVQAVGETGLKDSTTGELVVTATSIPTVDTKTTTDKIAPVLTGTVGSSKSLTITIKSTPQVSGSATISGTTWSFTSPSIIAAGNYDVVALGETGLTDATTNELTVTTCTLPKVSNAAGDACIDPVPTVVAQTTNSNTPVITGTVGVVNLGTTETFTVTVNGKTYDKSATSSPLVVSGLNWTLTIPATNAIPAGIYDVDAVRNTVSKDTTSKELTINLVCALPQVLNPTRTACITPSIPTVDTTTTTDQIPPTLTGTVGSSTSLSISVLDSSGAVKTTGTATITGTTWSFTPSAPIAKGIYDVSAVGETGLTDATLNELTVTMDCPLPKVANAAGSACVTPTPTVTFLNTANTTPTLTGTVGTTALVASETFIVSVAGQTYSKNDGHLSVSGTGWTLNVATAIVPGTYDVDAVRQGVHDETTGELTITDNIDICDNGVTKQIARSAFDGSKMGANYYLGKCNIPPCSNPVLPTDPAECTPPLPDPKKDPTDCTKTDAATLAAIANGTLVCVLPSQPGALVDETITYTDPNGVNYCISNSISGSGQCDPKVDAGCIVTGIQNKSQASVTIKRARIANATTQGGKVCLYNTADCPTNQPSALVKYGTLTASSSVDLSNATVNKGVATNVNITGATLEGAFIDTPNDYVSSTGVVDNSGGNWITVLGGTTLKTPTDPNVSTAQKSIVTSGVITAGQDTQGNPIRGNITNAVYDTDVANAPTILTKGRRTQGTVVNATITGAHTTTVAGVTVIDRGTLVSGEIKSGTTPSTYGTVLNTTVTATTITQSASQCSAGGSITGVGSRGQLMWKEIVRKK